MRKTILALLLAFAAPALGQTPATETVTFEGLGTPIPFEPGVKVPKSARIKAVALQGGGKLSFKTRGGAKYAALVTVQGTTAVVGVNDKGKIRADRFLKVWLRKAKGARLDAFTPVNAGLRVDDNGTPSDAGDDSTFYDGTGVAAFRLYDSDKNLYPLGGSTFVVARSTPDPYEPPAPYVLTTTSLDFVQAELLSGAGATGTEYMVFDDFVVSWGH